MDMKPITDFVTGKQIDIVGPEISRQTFEKFLVTDRGFPKTDIQVDVPLTVQFKGEDYVSVIDLLVYVAGRAVMAVTCVAGSIGSYEREILAGARLLFDYQVPFAVSTDAVDAVVMDTVSGRTVGKGLSTVPTREWIISRLPTLTFPPYPTEKKEREMIIYRSFNLEKVNR